MPSNVKLFLILNYVSIAIGVVQSILNFSKLAAMTAQQGGATFLIIVQSMTVIFMVLIVSLAGFWRQNWARWTVLILFVLGMIPSIPAILALQRIISSAMIVGLVQIVLQVISLYFIFTGNAREWFKRAQPA